MSDDVDVIAVLNEMLDAAARVAGDGVFVTKRGRTDGQALTLVVAVGEGAEALNRILTRSCITDPRSTDADGEPR